MNHKSEVLGETGTGKSTLFNILAENNPNVDSFPASASLDVCTYKTVGKSANWLGNPEKLIKIYDTPGLGDFQAILTENDQLKKETAIAMEAKRKAGVFFFNF